MDFKNIEETDKFAVEGAENNSFNIGSFGNNFGFNTGSFSFSGNWNGETSSYEINNSFYDIYNSIPLAEYLSY